MAKANFKLVTIICEPVISAQIIETVHAIGATGYTLTEVKGEGSSEKGSGVLQNEKIKIEIICDEPLAHSLRTQVASEYFENYSLILYTADIEVIRSEKFE